MTVLSHPTLDTLGISPYFGPTAPLPAELLPLMESLSLDVVQGLHPYVVASDLSLLQAYQDVLKQIYPVQQLVHAVQGIIQYSQNRGFFCRGQSTPDFFSLITHSAGEFSYFLHRLEKEVCDLIKASPTSLPKLIASFSVVVNG